MIRSFIPGILRLLILAATMSRYILIHATDTVYNAINLNVAEWISQASGFTTTRGISYMSAADSNAVWATAYDPTNPTGACSDFTRTGRWGKYLDPGCHY